MFSNLKKLFPFVIALLVVAALVAITGEAQKKGGVTVSPDRDRSSGQGRGGERAKIANPTGDPSRSGFAESAPVRTFPAANIQPGPPDIGAENEEEEGIDFNPLNTALGRVYLPGPSYDGALQRFPKLPNATLPAPLMTFEGIPVNGGAPSDSNGDVGPNDYIETVNSVMQIFDKNGVPRSPAFRQSVLFASLGGICASVDHGDPVVLYDRMADRWLISQFSFASRAHHRITNVWPSRKRGIQLARTISTPFSWPTVPTNSRIIRSWVFGPMATT